MTILSTQVRPLVNIKPVHDFILIQKLNDEENIIQIPDGATNPLQQWLILAVAEGITMVAPDDRILVIPDARIVKIDGEQHIGLMHVNGVVGVVL